MSQTPFDPSRRRFLSLPAVAVVGGSGLMAGCGFLPIIAKPPKLYTLSPKSTFPDGLPVAQYQLGVEKPASPAVLSTAKIAVARGAYQMDYYSGALWVDDAPNMIQRLLIESFENSGQIVAVGRDSVGLRSNFVLRCEVREFQAEYPSVESEDAPFVHVSINAKLIGLPKRVIVAVTTETQRIVAPENKLDRIVETFDVALGRVLRQIVVWTLTLPETQGFRPR
ncbi:MAG: ABC-type transport auxiliary lipoprotein family protein [Alphaproteobacteria bacterium]|nr:ABC-type transport auxiliary lipoprotein family protein [Alphaproteobacteria bacterium]